MGVKLAFESGIGTYKEKTLHAFLKKHYEADESFHEVKYEKYIADVKRGNRIYEIQTAGFYKMRGKIAAFTEECELTVVYPIAHIKHLIWIDPKTGEATKPRKSPKTGKVYELFHELCYIKPLLDNPKLHFRAVLIDMDEYRSLVGWSEDGKKGSERIERIPQKIVEEIAFESKADFVSVIPMTLDDVFTIKDFAAEAKITLRLAGQTINVLVCCGILTEGEKKGRCKTFRRK